MPCTSSDYAGMTETKTNSGDSFELHGATAHDEDPSAWSRRTSATIAGAREK